MEWNFICYILIWPIEWIDLEQPIQKNYMQKQHLDEFFTGGNIIY